MLALSVILFAPAASAETRTLKLYYTHTRESAQITFKRNGRYIQSGLNELNQFLRDWRRNEPTKMDPRLFDLIWETYQAVGAREPIHVVSAYRSPETNSMLRKRSSGVAEKSQHMLGKAMDFFIPGVKLSKLRAAALKVQGGGVGYYPKSGSPFVHLDVGNVRHWPRMNRSELLALFPDGKTMHVPTDGKPLPGYKQALAAYNARKKNGGSAIQMASAPGGGGFLSKLFSGGADEEEDSGEIAVAAAPELARTTLPARAQRSAPRPAVTVAAAEPAVVEEPAPKAETPEAIIAALPARSIPIPAFAPRPPAAVGAEAPAAGNLVAFDTSSAASTPAAEEVQVALNIPVPTPRPDYQAPVQETASAVVAEAAAETQSGSAAIAQILTDKREAETVSVASAVPVTETKPEDWQQQVTAFAAVADPEPVAATSPRNAALTAEGGLAALKGGRVAAAPATPRLAMLERPEGVDAATVMITGVRTTDKAARLTAQDAKPGARPVVIPVQEEIAGWALQTAHVTQLRSASTPARAHEAIRTAPKAVYTSGFMQSAETIAADRFTGNAVTFLSVAKFATN